LSLGDAESSSSVEKGRGGMVVPGMVVAFEVDVGREGESAMGF
jgi:hypothetical protein